jgi:VCBS repeat-containing protein
VNADKLNNSLLDVNLATSALLEEFGHALDRRLNGSVDSPGDEGQLFAAEVSGVVLTTEQRALIDAEDDSAVLTIEGVQVVVEMATFTATTGTDNPTLSTGADTVTVEATNQIQTADTFSGGAGTDTIAIGAVGAGVSVDLSAAASNGSAGFLSFEAIQFLNTSGTSTATFAAEQFGSGKIELTSSFIGTASSQGVAINLAAAGSFDASGFTFSTWTSGTDSFSLNGSTGTETIVGSSQADSISGAAGNDTLSGGTGNDIIDGGNGNDRMSGGAGVDFFITSAAGGSSTAATSNSLAATISGSSVDNLIFDNGVDIITDFVVGTDILSGHNTQALINLVGQSRTLDLTANRGYYAYGEWDGRRFLFRSNWASSRYNDLIFVVGDSGALTPITSTGYTILTDISGSIDTIKPTITSFSTTTANGSYKAGDSINITANTNENILAGGQITVTLNASTNPTVILTAATTGSTLTGTYTIAAGQTSADLTVSSFAIGTGAIGSSNATPRDAAFGNALTDTTVPPGTGNIAGSYAIVVDTTAPAALTLTAPADSGSSSSDGITKNSGFSISTPEANATWQYSTNGGSNWTTGSATSFAVADGTYNSGVIQVRQIDQAGNPGPITSSTASVTIDTVAPTSNVGSQSAPLVEAGGASNATAGTAAATITVTKADALSSASFDSVDLTSNGWSSADAGATYTKAGSYGTATFTIASGVVSYSLNNSAGATQALTQGQAAADGFGTLGIVDAAGNSSLSEVISFAITGANDTPVLAAVTSGLLSDSIFNDSFSNITGTLVGLDVDAGTTLTYGISGGTVSAGTSTLAGTYGSLSINISTGAYTYTPTSSAINALSANATDSFTFSVSDGSLSTTTGFTVNIIGFNDTPVLTAVTSGSLIDTAANDLSFSNITGTLAGSDRDTGTTLTYGISGGFVSGVTSTRAGTYGFLSVNTLTGAYTYTPIASAINALSANATDSFTFSVSDGSPLSTTTGFTVNITGVNDTPVLAAVSSGSLIDTAANDLTFSNITGTLAGSDRDTGSTLTYGITGGTVNASTSTLAGTYGSLSVNIAGAYTYTPTASAINALSANATDTFTFSVSDGSLSTTTGFTVNITGVNDTPVLAAVTSGSLTDTAANDSFNPITGTLAGSDRDTGSILTYGITGGTVSDSTSTRTSFFGSLSVNTLTGAYTYTPTASAINGLRSANADTFTFSVSDGSLSTTTDFTVNITGFNDTTVLAAVTSGSLTDTAANDSFSNITGTLAGSDRDTGSTLTYGITGGTVNAGTSTLAGTYGTLSLNTSTGSYTYTPNASAINALTANASDSFTFTVSDGSLSTTTTGFTINITGVNDTPVLAAVTSGSLTDTAANDSFSNITGTLAGSDRDTGSTLTYGITGGTVNAGTSTLAGTYGSLSVNISTGAYTYTPTASAINGLSANATDSFTFSVSDGLLSTTTGFTVTINGTNDAAVLSSATVALDETNAPLTTSGTLTISDVDNAETFVAQTATTGTNGSFSITAAGLWSYTANSAFDSLNVGDSVSDTFSVAAADGTTTSVTVTINGTNDDPALTIFTAPVASCNDNTQQLITFTNLQDQGMKRMSMAPLTPSWSRPSAPAPC